MNDNDRRGKPGKTIIWQQIANIITKEWEDLTDEEKATFVELAKPTDEKIQLAQSVVVRELEPFLDSTLKEEIV